MYRIELNLNMFILFEDEHIVAFCETEADAKRLQDALEWHIPSISMPLKHSNCLIQLIDRCVVTAIFDGKFFWYGYDDSCSDAEIVKWKPVPK